MKRIGNLFERVADLENLKLADEIARKGKLHSYGVQLHDKNREANLLQLRQSLLDGTFHTSAYHIFTIFEPKERKIFRLPYYPDRILHHAVMQDPDGTRYCLKIDVRKFYPSINHDVMKTIVRRKIKDKRLLALLDEIIESVPTGVPIGNYLSQYFANLFLAYFDHWLKEEKRVKHYFRYADDMVIFADNKEYLHALLHDIRAYLYGLKLHVKRNYQVFPVDKRGVDFLGYVFFHTHTLLRKSIKQKLCRRVAHLNKRKTKPTKDQYKQQICSWWGWCKYCNSVNLINKLSKTFPYEIRFIRAKRTL